MMTVKIPLTKGQVAIVDDCDADLADFKWHVLRRNDEQAFYAIRGVPAKTKSGWTAQLMHRVILERKLGRSLRRGEVVDHKSLDGLDNRRDNLRLATHAENMRNRRVRTTRNSPYKGVRKSRSGAWNARITVNRNEMNIGDFDTARDAGIAYNHAAKEHFGKFALFNDIEGWENEHPAPREKYANLRKDNQSGYPGVGFHKRVGKWQARIRRNGKVKHLGYFDTPEEAQAARKFHGEFANFGTAQS